MNNIIDSHFHSLYMAENTRDLDCAWSSVCAGTDIGTVFDDLPKRSELLKDQKHIKLSAAMGPWETQDTSIEELDRKFDILCKNIETYRPSFIGEAGLDYYCSYGKAEIQQYLFIKHLKLAGELNKSIIIHNREADEDMVSLLKQYSPAKGGIIHCFSGSTEVMKTALDRGFYISYAGNVTYKKNQFLRDTLHYVPYDRLLIETDAPYLTPEPKRGTKNTPQFIIHTYNCIAGVLGKDISNLAEQVFENYKTIVNLTESV